MRGLARTGEPSPVTAPRFARVLARDAGDRHLAEVSRRGCPGRQLWVAVVGQIDNAHDLARELTQRGHRIITVSNAEVVAHVYEEWGQAGVERIWGAFAFALWDEDLGQLLLARDRAGARPLFYGTAKDSFAFASHLSALREVADLPWEVDPQAIDSFLSLGAVPSPLSIFRAVRKIPAGHAVTVKDAVVKQSLYWTAPVGLHRRTNVAEAEARFEADFRDAVDRMASHERSGLMLSGGPDSAFILAALSEVGRPPRTFSFQFAGGFNEIEGARRTAQHFQAEHRVFHLDPKVDDALPALSEHYEEPHGRASALGWHYVESAARDHVDLLLTGDGADEAFAGRDRSLTLGPIDLLHRFPGRRLIGAAARLVVPTGLAQPICDVLEAVEQEPTDRYVSWLSAFAPVVRSRLYAEDFAKQIEGEAVRRLIGELLAGVEHPHDQSFVVDTRLWAPEVVLATFNIADRAAISARTPFLDHRIVELAASIPPSLRTGLGTSKRFLRRIYAARLPPWLQMSRRRGGVSLPVGPRLRAELRPWIEDCLLSPKAVQRGYFAPASLRALVDQHVTGKADRGAQLWSLLMLELWHRRWVDR